MQEIALKLNGLNTDPNPLGSVPEGALVVAENVVIDKQDVIELRRGFNRYGTEFVLSGAEQINSNYVYQTRMLVSYASKMAYDSDGSGTWVDFTGTYDPPPTAYKMRSFQQNKNFYLLTSEGVQKLTSYNGTFSPSGAPQALGATATLISGSFFADQNQVGYQIVFGYTDDNGNLILGAPSALIIVINDSGSAKAVQLTCYIPDGVVVGYFIQIYRSANSGGVDIAPSPDVQLIVQQDLTSGEISAKQVVIDDNLPDGQRGAFLYTDPSQEGAAQANFQPPLCVDACLFNGSVFYFNVTGKQTLLLTLLSVNTTLATPSVGIGYFSLTADTTNTNPTLTNATSATTNIVVGQLVSGSGIQADSFISSLDLGADTITLTKNATATAAGVTCTFKDVVTFTKGVTVVKLYASSVQDTATFQFQVASTGDPAADIATTAQNLVNCFNLSTASSSLGVYAYYDSGFDELPGQIKFEEISLGGGMFSVTCTKPSAFFPSLSTAFESSADSFPNYAYFSKTNQPESVPLLNFLPIGSADQEIYRGIALKDSIVILKADGVFKITGADPTSFRVTLFDSTIRLTSIESAVAFNNQIYCYTNQGVVAINENGVAVISRPIETDLLRLSSSNYPNFPQETFGIGYESGRKYLMWTINAAQDDAATQAFVYNSFTNTWTKWLGVYTYGIVNPSDDKLYMCSGNSGYILQERKNFDISDYSDIGYDIDIIAVDGVNIEITDASNVFADIQVGFTLKQGDESAKIIEVVDSTNIVVDKVVTWSLAAAIILSPIPAEIQWAPLTGGNAGLTKQFRDILIFFRQADFDEIDIFFKSNFITQAQHVFLSPVRSGSWGEFPWGEEPWGGGPPLIQPIRTYIPLETQRCNWLDISISHSQADTVFALCGFSVMFNNVSSRMR
jgi:hypothetical protein